MKRMTIPLMILPVQSRDFDVLVVSILVAVLVMYDDVKVNRFTIIGGVSVRQREGQMRQRRVGRMRLKEVFGCWFLVRPVQHCGLKCQVDRANRTPNVRYWIMRL